MPASPPPAAPTRHLLHAADGFPLAVDWYEARGDAHGVLVIASATGVAQRYYRRFAEHAAARGHHVVSFDYRGVGASRPHTLTGLSMSVLDWGRLDLAAVVDFCAAHSALPLRLVGHSVGGHLLGMLPEPQRVARFCVFGTGSGYHGHMPLAERAKVTLFWRVITPPLVQVLGYAPFSRLGMGEDLPLGVYYSWRRWCTFRRYFFDDPAMGYLHAQFARVTTPILAINALDDLWALPHSRDAFLEGYRAAPIERRDLAPRAGQPIGHMGYFRPEHQALWDEALRWLEAPSAAAVSPDRGAPAETAPPPSAP